MSDLIEFLRARLDEDEQTALAASPGPWAPNDECDEVLAVDGERVADGFALSGRQLRATVDHIARHDPARALREVEAKRRILARHQPIEVFGIMLCTHCGVVAGGQSARAAMSWPCPELRDAAAAHSDHPDYRDEWRP